MQTIRSKAFWHFERRIIIQNSSIRATRRQKNNNCNGIYGGSQPLEYVRISPFAPLCAICRATPTILSIPLIRQFFHNFSNCILGLCLFIFVGFDDVCQLKMFILSTYDTESCKKLLRTQPKSPSKFLRFSQKFWRCWSWSSSLMSNCVIMLGRFLVFSTYFAFLCGFWNGWAQSRWGTWNCINLPPALKSWFEFKSNRNRVRRLPRFGKRQLNY